MINIKKSFYTQNKVHIVLCKTLYILFLLVPCFIVLSVLGCDYLTKPKSGIIRGELIIWLHEDIIDEKLEEFVSDYSEYQFYLLDFFDVFNIGVFRFNYRLINDTVFLEMIRNDERVRNARLHSYLD